MLDLLGTDLKTINMATMTLTNIVKERALRKEKALEFG